jgi:hypothetical protein
MRIALAAAVLAGSLTLFGLSTGAAVADDEQRSEHSTVKKLAPRDFEGSATIMLRKKAASPHRTSVNHSRLGGTHKSKLSTEQLRAYHGLCNRMNQEFTCTTGPKKSTPSRAVLALNLSGVARTLITRIRIPDPKPLVGPDPSANEWKMAAVGYPLWLWTATPTSVTDRVRAYGVTFTLRATWTSSRFDMGDGHQVTCTRTVRYSPGVKPTSASPACGYTYLKASLPRGAYTVTATTNWRITWSALGSSGTMPASFTGSRRLPVGELDALVVG